jgi:hypothetical protein
VLPHHGVQMCAGLAVKLRGYLKAALDGDGSQLHASAALLSRKGPRYPLDRMLGAPRCLSEGCGEGKNPAVPGIEPRSFNT